MNYEVELLSILVPYLINFLKIQTVQITMNNSNKKLLPRLLMQNLISQNIPCNFNISNSFEKGLIHIGQLDGKGLFLFGLEDGNISKYLKNIKINQEVFFFNLTSKELFEFYEINGVEITQSLTRIDIIDKGTSFEIDSTKTLESLVKRRSNLQGKHFIGMTRGKLN